MGKLKIQYSDKKITPWDGMKLLKDFMNHLGVISNLDELNLPQPKSNREYNPKTVILGFWLSIIIEGSRFSHSDWIRYDITLQSIFDIDKLPSSYGIYRSNKDGS